MHFASDNTGPAHPAVIAALERKVQYSEFYGRNFDNDEMSTL